MDRHTDLSWRGSRCMGWALLVPGLAASFAVDAGTFSDAVVAAQLKALAQVAASTPPPPITAPPVEPVPPPVHSPDLTINQVIDLDGALRDYSVGDFVLKEYSFGEPVRIQTGDSVDLTITFAGQQAIELTDLGLGSGSSLYAWLSQDTLLDGANSSSFTIANAYVELLGVDGSVIRTISGGTQSNGSAHLGPDFNGLLNSGETLVVTGYHAYFDVVALENGAAHYRGPWVYLQADQLHIVPVPEASTAGMMLAGLGLVGFACWRRRSPCRAT